MGLTVWRITFTSNSRGHLTVRIVVPEILPLPEVAVMVAVPAAMVVASPLLSTVAADVFDELQVTCVVMA